MSVLGLTAAPPSQSGRLAAEFSIFHCRCAAMTIDEVLAS
jgi:hypothetical protein